MRIHRPAHAQRVDRLTEGQEYDDGKHYTLQTYQDMADTHRREWYVFYHRRVCVKDSYNNINI